MSVIRRPGIGRRTRRRLDGLHAALSVAVVDALTVGCWFALVVVESRTAFTALAGLGVLLFGALLRSGLVWTTTEAASPSPPRHLLATVCYAGCWLGWLLLAETVGGVTGLLVAGLALTVALTVQFAVEFVLVHSHSQPLSTVVRTLPHPARLVGPAAILAFGATSLLFTVHFADWSVLTLSLPIGAWTLSVEIRTVIHGIIVLGCCSFVGHHRLVRSVVFH